MTNGGLFSAFYGFEGKWLLIPPNTWGKGRGTQPRNSFLERESEEREHTPCNPPQHLFQGGSGSEPPSFFFLGLERKKEKQRNKHTYFLEDRAYDQYHNNDQSEIHLL
jgi:hypothetical protein